MGKSKREKSQDSVDKTGTLNQRPVLSIFMCGTKDDSNNLSRDGDSPKPEVERKDSTVPTQIWTPRDYGIWAKLSLYQFGTAIDTAFAVEAKRLKFDTTVLAKEYKKYMFLVNAIDNPYELCPSEAVNAVWSTHTAFEESYYTFCKEVFGRAFEKPHMSPNKYKKTLDLYEQYYGGFKNAEVEAVWPKQNRLARTPSMLILEAVGMDGLIANRGARRRHHRLSPATVAVVALAVVVVSAGWAGALALIIVGAVIDSTALLVSGIALFVVVGLGLVLGLLTFCVCKKFEFPAPLRTPQEIAADEDLEDGA